MKIVIVGAGQVGGTLAETLAREYNDVTLIDIDEGVLRGLQDRLDVRTVVGTGSYPRCSGASRNRRRRYAGCGHEQR